MKEEKNFIIVAHSYQPIEIKKVADFIGDSLALVRYVKESDKKKVIVSAVDFMAETAKLYSPEKEIFVPAKDAGCPLASSITVEEVKSIRRENPNSTILIYVNSYLEAKAYCDIVVTSANAVKIVEKVNNPILLPDYNLACFAEEKSGKKVGKFKGGCYVHHKFTVEDIEKARAKYPNSFIIVHPEANFEVQKQADLVGSTSVMYREIANIPEDKVIILGTEIDMVTTCLMKYPNRNIVPLREDAVCANMKKNTLKEIKRILLEEPEELRITIEENELTQKAKRAIEKMYEILEE